MVASLQIQRPGIGVPDRKADTNTALERFFCVRSMAVPVMGGPCVGAFGLAGPSPVRQPARFRPP
nr:MAG TPA: hypothetical protein [Caudoviricetes sp.]